MTPARGRPTAPQLPPGFQPGVPSSSATGADAARKAFEEMQAMNDKKRMEDDIKKENEEHKVELKKLNTKLDAQQ